MVDVEFDQHESIAALTVPVQVNNIKKGDFCMVNSHPCKIVEMLSFKNGKHGHAKTHIIGIDIFTSKKYEDMLPSAHTCDTPIVTRHEYTCNYIDNDGFLSLLMEDNTTRSDLKVEEGELRSKIEELLGADKSISVSALSACNEEHVVAIKSLD
jgi:translation initiation factor 5A